MDKGGTRVLVIEDERDIAGLVKHTLERSGDTRVEIADSGDQALRLAGEQTPDLIILDLNLPVLGGLEVCRLLRTRPGTARTPIIMLTARTTESDRVVGLDAGADDYISKPFSPKELVARVSALLRRATRKPVAASVLHYRNLSLDRDRHIVSQDGREITLTAKEFLLLEYLIQHQGRVLSRDVLLTDVWGYQYTGGTRTVDVHVRRLREKLPLLADAIHTIKQFGYKLQEP